MASLFLAKGQESMKMPRMMHRKVWKEFHFDQVCSQLTGNSADGQTRVRAIPALLPAYLVETNSLAHNSQKASIRA